ncbi:DUF5677 domain-containing protein [Bacillus cytotoxicus]|uniref:DUF5677 domain-containing protein n=1 Tax=Bacillus cytotoxicus TaxID=580165 RepID=UPI001AEDFEC0|nr:DUF5677 domain-containing protein [Bacillus cytotoxicus]QTR88981.1 hypothetical protein JC774_11140 [Bacillus cytotoxicus]
MNIEHEIDKLGLVIQKGEEFLNYSYKDFSERHPSMPDEIMVGMLLYGKVIENLDAIFILLENASEQCAESITRDLFENMLYLKFILDTEHFKKRALAYYYCYVKNRLTSIGTLLSETPKGIKIRKYMNKKLPDKNLEQLRDSFEKIISEEKFKEIKNEWNRLKRRNKKYYPKWHRLFDGPEKIRDLAVYCGFEVEYDILYGAYSKQVHSTNALQHLEIIRGGRLGIKRLRTYYNPQGSLVAARSFGIAAIKYYIDFFLPELNEEFADWYIKEIDPDILVKLDDKL